MREPTPLPTNSCDLVMKGGIASGVVYPTALLVLKDRYRFANIGGTSAGAIAAGFAAAAESGRQSGGPGFDGLAECHRKLSEDGFLLGLFQPTRETKPVFDFALSMMGEDAKRPAGALDWIDLALGASGGRGKTYGTIAAGLGVGFLAGAFLPGKVGGLLAALGGAAGALAGVGVGAMGIQRTIDRTIKTLEGNGFGLIAGFRGVRANANQPSLSEWLASSLDYMAGRVESQLYDVEHPAGDVDPLTFGDLQGGVRLQFVTSNLSQNRPYVLPFDPDRFVFEEAHFRTLFPKRVVDYMVRKAREEHAGDSRVVLPSGYYFLPKGEALPIVVGTRLSLSFPILLSAVPLYTFAASAYGKKGQPLDPKVDLQKNWFSDGGISSNFPIHFFDAILPTRPTFGINLVGWKEQDQHVGTTALATEDGELPEGAPPRANDEGVFIAQPNRVWHPDYTEIRNLPGFLMNVYATSKEYRDNLQARLPSVRDRVVNIKMRADEGGLNLKMAPELLAKLAQRGEAAGRAIENFPFEPHLWLRFRVLIPELAKAFDRLGDRLPEVKRIVGELDAGQTNGYSYKGNAQWRADARQAIDEIVAMCERLDGLTERLQEEPPKPRGHLRITPPM